MTAALPRRARSSGIVLLGLALVLAALLGAPGPVGAASLPDLRVTKGDVAPSPGGDRITGRFTVRNAGAAPAAVSTAHVSVRYDGRFQYLTELRILRLTPGTNARYAFDTARPAHLPTGTHAVRVCLDVQDKVHESLEGNNCRGLGDLTLQDDSPIDYQPDTRFLRGTTESGYYGWVPSGYDDTHATPSALFVWLHGCGGESRYDIESFAPDPSESYVMIAPTGREGACWQTPANGAGDDDLVLSWIDDAAAHFNVDPDRVVLGGYSSGGDLAYRVAYRHSDVVGAVLAANSAPFRDTGLTSQQALAAASTPFRVVHLAHTEDTTYPIAQVRAELQKLRDAGFTVQAVERSGTHYDQPSSGVPGTEADIRTYLLPAVDP